MLELDSRLATIYRGALTSHLTGGSPYALLDYPDYTNVGDCAIFLGQLRLLDQIRIGLPDYISTFNCSWTLLDKMVPAGPILLQGGGNFGDLWPRHQEFRLEVLARYPGRRTIQLPQSIHFSVPEFRDATARAISAHSNFHLMVRDQKSFEYSQKHFDCEVELVPDAAHALEPVVREPGSGILTLARADKERKVHDLRASMQEYGRVADWPDDRHARRRVHLGLINTFKAQLASTRAAAMKARLDAYHDRADERLSAGLAMLTNARVIVSDRLHAHILSEVCGRRHYVLDNSYGKVSSYIDTWGASELTTVVHSLSQLRECLNEHKSD